MRTTTDLPDDDLHTTRIVSERSEERVQFPLMKSRSPRSLDLTNADFQRIEDEDEERRLGFAD